MPVEYTSLVLASETALAPRIIIGIANGRIRRLSSAVPRCSPTVRAAPIEPSRLRLIVPSQSVSIITPTTDSGMRYVIASIGETNTSGSPLVSQCERTLPSTNTGNGWGLTSS